MTSDLTPAMQRVLQRIAQAGRPPLHTLPPEQARALYAAGAEVLEPVAPAVDRVESLSVTARDGHVLPLQCWYPLSSELTCAVRGAPALLYLHGGGFTVGSPTTHGQLCQRLAAWSGCRVYAVDYRLAPTHQFPTAHLDAWDTLNWLHHHSRSLGLDANRLAVAGDSAGGTLSASLALMARDAGLPLALHLMFYPGCVPHQNLPSHRRYAHGYLLEADAIDYFYGHYLRHENDRLDWRFSPTLATDHEGLAPAWFGLAECDPLFDEGMLYADQLRHHGVTVDLNIYRGVVHGFIQMGRAIPEALQAVQDAAQALRAAMHIPAHITHPPFGTLRIGSWTDLHDAAGAVRTAVFVHEQGIPVELEWDEQDDMSTHVVLYTPQQTPIATARLLPSHEGVSLIGRVAVLQAWRGQQAGIAVMRALMRQARQRGDQCVKLHSQQSAQGFYEKLGFVVEGEPFDEVGIPHVTMSLSPLPD